MLSRFGVVPYANSLDTVGLLARAVAPIRDLVLAGPDHPGRLGRAARALQDRCGARVVPVSLPSTRHALAAYYVIAPAEASSNLAKYDGVRYGTRDAAARASDAAAGGVLYAASRGSGFGDEVKRRILLGSYTLSSEAMDNYFIQAQRVRRLVRRDFDRVFALDNPLHEPETFDLAALDELADVMRQTPLDAYMNDVFTVPASLAGLPAISIPMPLASAPGTAIAAGGGPRVAGLQLIGQYWDDARLLAVAEAVAEVLRTAPLSR
ncbi:hypothetical protein VTH06DRAFT_8542 [Thermothelomyces fergusii]